MGNSDHTSSTFRCTFFSHFSISEIGIYLTINGILQLKMVPFLPFLGGIHTTKKEIMLRLRVDGLLNLIKCSIRKGTRNIRKEMSSGNNS